MAIQRMGLVLALSISTWSAVALAAHDAGASASSPVSSAAALRSCLEANRPSGTYSGFFEVETRGKGVVNRVVTGRIYLQVIDGVYESTLQIKSPGDVAGVSYLIRELGDGAEAFIRVPALNRTRRLKIHDEDEPLPGLSISHSDVRQIYMQFEQAAETYPAQLQGRPLGDVGFLSKPDNLTPYRRVQTWLDDSTCLPVRMELERKSGVELMARFDSSRFQRIGGSWVPTNAVVSGSNGNQLSLRLDKLERGDDLSARLFHPSSFFR